MKLKEILPRKKSILGELFPQATRSRQLFLVFIYSECGQFKFLFQKVFFSCNQSRQKGPELSQRRAEIKKPFSSILFRSLKLYKVDFTNPFTIQQTRLRSGESKAQRGQPHVPEPVRTLFLISLSNTLPHFRWNKLG